MTEHYVTTELFESVREESRRERAGLSESIGNLGKQVAEVRTEIAPMVRLVNGDGRPPLGERIALIEQYVTDRRRLTGQFWAAVIVAAVGWGFAIVPKILELVR